jgi:hypothetical protein
LKPSQPNKKPQENDPKGDVCNTQNKEVASVLWALRASLIKSPFPLLLENWVYGQNISILIKIISSYSANTSFSHPDYTVGFGISPNQPKTKRLTGFESKDSSPPVGNLTLPRRINYLAIFNFSLL